MNAPMLYIINQGEVFSLNFVEYICLIVILVALSGIILRKNLVMKIVCLDIMSTGVVSFFVVVSSRFGEKVPIVSETAEAYAHPVPQAVIVTAIVIGFATLSLSFTVIMILIQRLHTTDTEKIERRTHE